ncbi:MAG: lysophospholipase [Rhodothermales bacterium]
MPSPSVDSTPQYLNAPGGPKLFFRSWLPPSVPKSVVLLVHGLAEHSGRYEHVASRLIKQGHAVFGFDFRGHGQSEGKRIYVNHFSEFVDDLAAVYTKVKASYPSLPFFILAHSMGTTVSLNFLIDKAPQVSGVILSGTALMAGSDISPILISLSGIIGALLPKLPTVRLNSRTISRDPAIVQGYHNDPLVYNGKIPARTGAELNRVFGYIQWNLSLVTCPLLILHGKDDELANPEGSNMLYKGCAAEDKTLKLWNGLYHEILNEPEKDEVIDLLSSWIEERV